MSGPSQCPVCGTPKSGLLEDNCPVCLLRLGTPAPDAESASDPAPGPHDPQSIRRLGDYELLDEIARGGMGVVYRARQVSLNRTVAVKVLLGGHFANKTFARRFRREAEAAASLNHPNIVSIYEIGEHEGQPYFSMELVEGRNLAELTGNGPLPSAQSARLVREISDAVHFAHSRGVLHRDLKPSNVLVDATDRPRVMDFGLAKRVEGDADLTLTGQVLGTPNYMPPEQADPRRGEPTPASDVYSLGAILYHLLTGRAPFLSQTVEATLRQVLDQDPVPLRLLNIAVPRDLETLCLKCLDKEPNRRFASAAELADELDRWLKGRPIQSRPAGRIEKLWRWCRRNPALSSGVAAASLALLLGFSAVTWLWRTAEQHRLEALHAKSEEQRLRREAEAQELAVRRKAYASDMKLLQRALASDDLARAQELLDGQRPAPGEPDVRGWEWRYLWQFCQSDAAFTLGQQTNSVISVSFSRDGALLAAGSFWRNRVAVWDIARRATVLDANQDGETTRVAFAPDRDVLVYYKSGNRPSAVLWDTQTKTELHRLPLNGALRGLAFTTNGMLFTIDTGATNNLTAWDVATATPVRRFTARLGGSGMGVVFAVTADGSRIAHAILNAAHSVRVADLHGDRDVAFRVADELLTAVAFSPDGDSVLTGSGYGDGAIKVWEASSGRFIGSLEGHRSWISALKFLPDGKTLVSASADRTIRLWNFQTREPIRTLRGYGGELWTIDVSPDGRWLASGGKDGSVILWDLTSSANRPPLVRTLPIGSFGRWAHSPDGRWLAVLERRRSLKLYDAATLRLEDESLLPFTNILSIAFSPDAPLLVVTDAQGNLGTWDIKERKLLATVAAHAGPAYITPPFLRGGRALTFGSSEHLFKEWDTATWKELRRWSATSRIHTWAVSPESDLLATGNSAGMFELISLRDSTGRRFSGEARTLAVDLAPDGKTFVAANETGTLEIWDTATVTRRALRRGVLLGYHSVAVSPDNQRVAVGSNGQEAIKLWDLHSLEDVATLAGQGSFFADAAFSPDGSTISARNWNWMLHLWRAPPWTEIEAAERPSQPTHPAGP